MRCGSFPFFMVALRVDFLESWMQIGMVGLGRMGSNMVQRLLRKGHDCVVYDSHVDAREQVAGQGGRACADLPELVAALAKPRAIWLMVPAAVVDGVLNSLLPLL